MQMNAVQNIVFAKDEIANCDYLLRWTERLTNKAPTLALAVPPQRIKTISSLLACLQQVK